MKTFLTLLISLIVISCGHKKPSVKPTLSAKQLSAFQHLKDSINKYSLNNRNEMLTFAMVSGNAKTVKVFNGKWPEETEYAYNVLLSNKGKVIMIMESPTSESGDWNLECYHYFDSDGGCFCYEVEANSFALPDDGVAYETTTRYFNKEHTDTLTKYKLVDKDGKTLNKKLYGFDAQDRGFNLAVYKTVDECLAGYHISLK